MSKIAKIWHRFIQFNFNAYMRHSPNLHKERKYENIDIEKKFNNSEKIRKKQRLSLINYRKTIRLKYLENQIKLMKIDENSGLLKERYSELYKEIEKGKNIKEKQKYKTFIDYLESLKKKVPMKITEKNKENIEKELIDLKNEISNINDLQKELATIDEKLENLEPNHILIHGTKKQLVLNMILYYEFHMRNLEGAIIHPEAQKNLEIAKYHVENNLPLRREVIKLKFNL